MFYRLVGKVRFILQTKPVRVVACIAITLTISGIFFASAVFIGRTNSLITKGDSTYYGSYSVSSVNTAWDALDGFPRKIIMERGGAKDELLFRKAVTLLAQKKTEEALLLFEQLGESEDKKLASRALTMRGKILVFEAIDKNDAELLASALEATSRAVELDADNEDAKYNLEFFQTGLQAVNPSDQDAPGDLSELPGEIPGSGAGESEPHSGY